MRNLHHLPLEFSRGNQTRDLKRFLFPCTGSFKTPPQSSGRIAIPRETKDNGTEEENIFIETRRKLVRKHTVTFEIYFVRAMGCEYFALVLSCLAAAVRSQQEFYDYCDPKLKLCEVATDHTICKYPIPGLSPQCNFAVNEPLNSTEKDRILFLHNKFRSYIAEGTEKNKIRRFPLASNMRQLYWDSELEYIAARWADQCIRTTSHSMYDKCRNTKRFQVSQNIGSRRVNGSTIDKQAPQIVITWYKESKDFDPSLVERFTPDEDLRMSVRQFANIIWADTYAVGCARTIFQEQLPISDKDLRTLPSMTERLVCNYGPGGSEIGKPIYKRGAPCENCPAGTQCSTLFPGLCATQFEKPKEQQKVQDFKAVEKDEGKAYTKEFATEGLAEQETERKDASPEGECRGEGCFSSSSTTAYGPRVNQIMKIPGSTAPKKSLELGLLTPSHGEDIFIEKEKWNVESRKNVREDKSEEKKMKNGDYCKCYTPGELGGSSRMKQNIFLLLSSAFMAVKCFLFHTSK